MSLKVLILGNLGSIGQRYTACLNHFCVPHMGYDIRSGHLTPDMIRQCSHAIVATPTARHIEDVDMLSEFNIPILCEKPVAKDAVLVAKTASRWDRDGVNVRFLNQYAYVARHASMGHTYYNFFKTGNDGLQWDCINVIGTAESDVFIQNDSPIWTCTLNGFGITLRDMDISYLTMINDWLEDPRPNFEYMVKAHDKAQAYGEAFLGRH